MKARAGARSLRLRAVLAELGFTGASVAVWRERAGCRGTDPELFYPVGAGPLIREQVEHAKQVCAGCPVREFCLADVMGTEDPALRWGVIGGLSADERAELFARQRRVVGRAVA